MRMPAADIPKTRFEQRMAALTPLIKLTQPELIELHEMTSQRARGSILAELKSKHDTRVAKKADAIQRRTDRLSGTGEFALPARELYAERKLSNPEMPAFDELVQRTSGKKTLRGYKVIGIQHLLGSTGALARALTAKGVRPEDTTLLGRTYSQVESVTDELTKDGFHIREASWEGDLGTSWGHGQHNRQAELLDALDAVARGGFGKPVDRSHKYLVIDDGGELLETINEQYPELHDRIVGVEQTTRGIRKLEKMNLKFPVVTVGDAAEKLVYESPMIGRSLGLTGHARLERIRAQGFDVGKDILIIGGAGSVGAAAVRSYTELGYRVHIFDKRATEAAQVAHREGAVVETSLDEALRSAKIVLSLTGTATIGDRELELLPTGAVLMNGASSATEIKSPELPDGPAISFIGPASPKLAKIRWENQADEAYDRQVRSFLGRGFDIGGTRATRSMIGHRRQHDAVIRLPSGKEHILVNQGQVINFDDTVDPIPPRYIQLTRGLLYMAAVQAANTKDPGTHKLDPKAAQAYRESVEHDLARSGETLAHPKF